MSQDIDEFPWGYTFVLFVFIMLILCSTLFHLVSSEEYLLIRIVNT